MDDPRPLAGGTTEMFAGIAVRDFQRSLAWYRRLLGAEPAFYPNDREAVWLLAPQRWLYIIVDPKRAGGGIQTIMLDDLEAVVEGIAARGLEPDDEEVPAENTRKLMYRDPDGNEIGLGRIPAA